MMRRPARPNLWLAIAVILLTALPLWLVETPVPGLDGQAAAVFAGADDQAKALINRIAPDYRPWFKPLLEPASEEIVSLLFALQAAIGAGFIGYYLGVSVTREKMKSQQPQATQAPPAGQGGENDQDQDQDHATARQAEDRRAG